MALGTLTKGLIAIVLTFGIVFIYALLTKNFKLIFKTFSPVGILIFLTICVPWFYLVCRDNPDFFYFFFIHEHFLRYLTTTHHRYQPFYFFIPCIILGIFPWTGYFFSCLLSKSPKKTWHKFLHNPDRFKFIYLCLWFTLIFIFYSLSILNSSIYFTLFYPLSILIAYHLQQIFYQPKKIGIALIINAFISLLIIVALVITAMKSDFISLQEFIFSGSFIILVLIIFNLISLITWYKYKNLKQLLSIHIITAIFVSFSLQPVVITQIAQHRTGKDIAETLIL